MNSNALNSKSLNSKSLNSKSLNSNDNNLSLVRGVAPFDAADTKPWPGRDGGAWAITVHVEDRLDSDWLAASDPGSRQEALVYLCDDRPELDSDRHTRRFRQMLPGGSVAVVLFRLPRVRSWGRPMWVVLVNDRRNSHGTQWWFAHRCTASAHYQTLIADLPHSCRKVAPAAITSDNTPIWADVDDCAGCGCLLLLDEAHYTVAEHIEVERDGSVTVLDARVVEYRHLHCPRETADAGQAVTR